MASLADAPDLVGFFSYSREDDEGSGGRLSKLRSHIQEELRAQLGRTKRDFRLWQDKTAIAHGELWEDRIKTAIAELAFFIPIITPTAVRSYHCKFEFDAFLVREKEFGRSNLVFPILYIPVPALMDDRWRRDPLLSIIGSRQYEEWQNLRHLDPSSTEVALRVEKFCANICKALQQPWLSQQERQEAEARRVTEDERRRHKKLQEEARQRAEAERRRQEAEKKRQLIAVDAASAPKSTVRRALFTPGPVLGGFIAATVAAVFLAVFLLPYLIWSQSQQLAPTRSDPASVQPPALANTNAPNSVSPAAPRTQPTPVRTVPIHSTDSFEIQSNMEAAGRDVDYIVSPQTVPSVGECKQKCIQSARCNAFAFAKRPWQPGAAASGSGFCYLYSRAELVPNSNFDSGIRK
jgi:TIR domain-containing protein/PAN domain-containing protein